MILRDLKFTRKVVRPASHCQLVEEIFACKDPPTNTQPEIEPLLLDYKYKPKFSLFGQY